MVLNFVLVNFAVVNFVVVNFASLFVNCDCLVVNVVNLFVGR